MTSEGHTEQLHHPFVYWAQDADFVYLKVELFQVQEPSLKIAYREDGMQLSALAKHTSGLRAYSFELSFYGDINAQDSYHTTQPSYVRLFIPKSVKDTWWPRLTQKATKVPWLRVDFEKWKDKDEGSNLEADDECGEKMTPGKALRKALKMDGNKRKRRPSETIENLEEDTENEDMPVRNRVLASAVHHRRMLVKSYLVMYNLFLFVGYGAIFAELVHGFVFEGNDYFPIVWRRVGVKMKYCVLAQMLEIAHALVGYTGSNWAAAFVQVGGRAFCLFVVIGGDERMHDKPMTFYIFAVYSLIEIFRYPYYTLSVLGISVPLITWLRYTMWLPLYPLGFMLEGAILLRAVPYYLESGTFSVRLPNRANVSFDFAYFLLTFMLVAFFPMVWFLFKHMLRQRRKKLFGRTRPANKKLR